MKTTKKCLMEQIQEEFAERYGISPDQVKIDINISEVPEKLGVQIMEDYNQYHNDHTKYFKDGDSLEYGHTGFGALWVGKESKDHE